MKTLFVVPWDQEVGGVASIVGNLATYLQKKGHQVLFFHPGKSIFLGRKTTKWGFAGFQLRLVCPWGWRRPVLGTLTFPLVFSFVMLQLIYLIRKERIQIINIHFPVEAFFYFALCRRLLNIRLVTSLHGSDAFPNGKVRKKYSLAFRGILSGSDRVVTPSRVYRKNLLAVFPDLTDKTLVVHNGLNLAEFSRPSEATNGELGRYLLCVAYLFDWKGVDVLLRASKLVLETEPSVNLVLVGDGPLRGQLEALAVSLGVQERVKFLGTKGKAEIVKLLYGCEIFVLPSRAESFGIAVIEALACRRPVVATRVGGIPEIVEDGKNGILVQPDDPAALAEALIALLKNPAMQEAFTSNGYATVVDSFRFEMCGEAYEKDFESLLRGSARGEHSTNSITPAS